jgi:protein TonB
MLMTLTTYGQAGNGDTLSVKTDSPSIGFDEPVSFPGGTAAMQKFLSDNLVYPQTAYENGIQGKVYLQFKVGSDGTISDIQVIRGVPDCHECDKEAIRLLKLMPRWNPAKQGGKPVDTLLKMPFTFSLY